MSPLDHHRRTDTAVGLASEVVESLEVLWEHGREVSTAPVSTSQLRVLYILERNAGINLRTLAESLGSAPPSVSRLCDRLQALGFVERTPSPASGRELELRLSPQAWTYLQELRARREKLLAERIAAMPPSARAALVDGLAAFRAAGSADGDTDGGDDKDVAAQSA